MHSKFASLYTLTSLEVSNVTGCLPPCSYIEYRAQITSVISVSWDGFQMIQMFASGKQYGDPVAFEEHLALPAHGDRGSRLHRGVLGRWVWGNPGIVSRVLLHELLGSGRACSWSFPCSRQVRGQNVSLTRCILALKSYIKSIKTEMINCCIFKVSNFKFLYLVKNP